MCGIAGLIALPSSSELRKDIYRDATRMTGALAHRGPDGQGVWVDNEMNIGLGHRRLSILDLSSAGAQPMESSSGRYVLTFNGEIYSHQVLRAELERQATRKWRGTSDTETLLAGFDVWGIRETLAKIDGMFAFGVWDKKDATLILARDRLGEKPLYYGWQKNYFLFASELKSFRTHDDFEGEIDRASVALLLTYGCIPAPNCIYKGIFKLKPGELVSIRGDFGEASAVRTLYWSARSAAENGIAAPFDESPDAVVTKLESLLTATVEKQLISDVPVGAFLSGGVDSSLIVALMQSISSSAVRTFTIGFDEKKFSEADDARRVSRHIGTEHTELYVSPVDAQQVIPQLGMMYDEPFSDASQIPTYLVSKLASQQVKVALSGDGGDEMFAGYNRHKWWNTVWSINNSLGHDACMRAVKAITAISPKAWDKAFSCISWALPPRLRERMPGERVQKFAGLLGHDSPTDVYRAMVTHWPNVDEIVVGVKDIATKTENYSRLASNDFTADMLLMDQTMYLPDDIMVKVDRAAMNVGLETRAPYLDHSVVEFSWRIPMEMKLRGDQTKWILRKVLHKYVPEEFFDRPKMGFGLPIGDWLRGPLRDWVEDSLDLRRLQAEGYFYPDVIRRKWEQHLSGTHNWQYLLWDVLMFQTWLQTHHQTKHTNL